MASQPRMIQQGQPMTSAPVTSGSLLQSQQLGARPARGSSTDRYHGSAAVHPRAAHGGQQWSDPRLPANRSAIPTSNYHRRCRSAAEHDWRTRCHTSCI